MIEQKDMDDAVVRLAAVAEGFHTKGVTFHDKVESQGWKLWVTRHVGQQPKVSLTGSVSGFPIELELIRDGWVKKNIPTVDQALAAILLDLVKNATESLQVVLDREGKSSSSSDSPACPLCAKIDGHSPHCPRS